MHSTRPGHAAPRSIETFTQGTARETRGKLLAMALVGCVAAVGAQAQTTYTATDISPLPGCVRSTPHGLNDQGTVVGDCNELNGNTQAGFVWRNGVTSATGKLPGGTYSTANAVNAGGKVVGEGDSNSAVMLGWVSTANGLFNFFSNKGGLTRAMFIADNGTIGGRYTSSNSGWVAAGKGALWIPDAKDPRKYRKVVLPIIPGGIDPKSSYAFPNDFNQSGQAVGYATTDQLGQHAVLWNNDALHSIVDLGTVLDGYIGVANGMNDLGQVVGEANDGRLSQPVMWDNDESHTGHTLPTLAGDQFGSARDINNRGEIIGSSVAVDAASNEVSRVRPVVWQNGAAAELQSLLDPVSGQGLTITEAMAINNAGQIAVSAVRDGQVRAVLLTPQP